MYHPASGRDQDEWLEIYNAGDDPVSLAEYRLSEGVLFDFPDRTLAAGEYLVVAADPSEFAQQYPDVQNVVGGWTDRLGNGSEDIVLSTAAGIIEDRAVYSDSGDWSARRTEIDLGVPGWTWSSPHDGGGSSLELLNPAMPHDVGHNWSASSMQGGTPGAPNSTRTDNVAPMIFDVMHSPAIPTSQDAVTVTATIRDEVAGATAALWYRVSTMTPGDFASTVMYDDGQHGDGAASDGVYAATLEPQADATVIEFYVEAHDASEQRRTSPAATDDAGTQGANYLYQVDDTVRPSDLPLYRSIMTLSERRLFETQSRASDAQHNATFIATVGGQTEVRYNAGVRIRGSNSRSNNPPNNRINLPSDQPWQGITSININAVAPHSQVAGATIFGMAGLPASDAYAVRMLSNGQDLMRNGFYAHVEVLNGDWAEQHFPMDSQGNVYKGRRANEGPIGGAGAGLQYFGENPQPYVSYLKGSNTAQSDYTDVIELTRILNTTSDENFWEELQQVANVDQWMRAIALTDLIGNDEFGLLTGDAAGDDYAMYRGVTDPRFLMLPYDLDSLFVGTRSPLLQAERVPALRRVLAQPEARSAYYRHLLDLMDNNLTEANLRPALEETLGKVRTPTQINSIFSFLNQRFAYIRSLIPQTLTVNDGLTQFEDVHLATSDRIAQISGTAPIVETRRVLVNGQAAAWNGTAATWSLNDVPLQVGMNRIVVEAIDAEDQVVATQSIDVFWEPSSTQAISGELSGITRWTAAEGPYVVSGNVTVPSGAELIIEPGTNVYFSVGASLIVNGRLDVSGSDTAPIWLTRVPNTRTTWNGIQFVGSQQDNTIQHAILQHGVTDNGMIGLENSQLTLDHNWLGKTTRRRIRSIDSSLVVRNSYFDTIAAPGVAPATDNLSEQIWGRGIPGNGQWLIENNVFGHTTGHNDVIDFDSARLPNPIAVIRNNLFQGGGDDALDMTGDVYIEGNVFRNFIKDEFNLDPGESNTVSSSGGNYYYVRNIFENVQHAALIKETAYGYFLHNTVVSSQKEAIYFDLPGQTSGPGRGAQIEGNIFPTTSTLFDQVRPTTQLSLDYSLVPAEELSRGSGNRTGNATVPVPNFADVTRVLRTSDFAPLAGSLAYGNARNGLDMGATIPSGAIVASGPSSITANRQATFVIGGAGIVNYRYRIDGGTWSDPRPVATPVSVSGLVDGEHTLEVMGENLIGMWQEDTDLNPAYRWTIDSRVQGVRINEILASNTSAVEHDGSFPDVVELYNFGSTQVDLSGMGLSDNPSAPAQFVFPAGTTLDPDQYLVVYADSATTPGFHLGFGLSSAGETLTLSASSANGGAIVDQVTFGLQVPNMSIGRDSTGAWTATQPTFGAANQTLAVGDEHALRINEWLAAPEVVLNDDFVELYNPSPGPVDLSRVTLTDTAFTALPPHHFPPLSYIAAGGFVALQADGNTEQGADHVNFGLNRFRNTLGLFDLDGNEIHVVRLAAQQPDQSAGYAPDGSSQLVSFELPTPGLSNATQTAGTEQLVPLEALWSYNESGDLPADNWMSADYDDSSWPQGPATLYVESSALPAPKNTPLTLGQLTYYFRHHFTLDSSVTAIATEVMALIDDGAIVYLNGQEVL
ncbi:MAG: lamin tail domain-containing protein, partial [Planctomycetales bacterium]|nr:lamin tail domain-containing protein [Planctomycetales bacterium]